MRRHRQPIPIMAATSVVGALLCVALHRLAVAGARWAGWV
jgi:hypothetical protein